MARAVAAHASAKLVACTMAGATSLASGNQRLRDLCTRASSTLLGRVWWPGSAVLSRHDPSGDRGGPAPAAGFRRGDARRAAAEGPAGGGRAVRARAAD